MPNDKKTGETHLPEIEADQPLQEGSERGPQARRQEGEPTQGVRKAGIVTEGEQERPADRQREER